MGLFLHVLGTDTGVGKTVVTIGLARALAASGRRVSVAKPFATGANGDGIPEDTATLTRAFPELTAEAVTAWQAAEPLAPAVAASRAGTTVPLAQVAQTLRERAAETELLLTEGIGGVRTPLGADSTYLDLVTELGGAAVIVARPSLGTLNHTALTVEACRAAGVPILGVIPSHTSPPGDDVATATNADALADSLDVPVWDALDHQPGDPAAIPAGALGTQAAAITAALWSDTATLPLEHVHHTRVRYGETDQMGVVYHGDYFAWFDMGRTELLRAQGLPYSELERRGHLLTVTEASARYIAPARYDEQIRIHTALVAVRGVRLQFQYTVRRAHDGAHLADGATTLACVDRDGRPRRLPAELTRLLPDREPSA